MDNANGKSSNVKGLFKYALLLLSFLLGHLK